jgi:hypothetical protein
VLLTGGSGGPLRKDGLSSVASSGASCCARTTTQLVKQAAAASSSARAPREAGAMSRALQCVRARTLRSVAVREVAKLEAQTCTRL